MINLNECIPTTQFKRKHKYFKVTMQCCDWGVCSQSGHNKLTPAARRTRPPATDGEAPAEPWSTSLSHSGITWRDTRNWAAAKLLQALLDAQHYLARASFVLISAHLISPLFCCLPFDSAAVTVVFPERNGQ